MSDTKAPGAVAAPLGDESAEQVPESVDRAAALDEVRQNHVYGPFETADEVMRFLAEATRPCVVARASVSATTEAARFVVPR